MDLKDIDSICDYWFTSPDDHLVNMGVDLSKMPARQQFYDVLQSQLSLPHAAKKSYCLIWEANGEAIGHCNANPVIYGNEAYMHLHMWIKSKRNRGLGSSLVEMSLPYFFKNLQLSRLISEPYALNDAPNKTLQRVGFRFIREYITVPGSLSFEQPVKQWELGLEDFKKQYPKG